MADRPTYWLTRLVFLRLLALVYVFAFLCTLNQSMPLLGREGLLPAATFLGRVREALGPASAAWRLPTLFWLDCSDTALRLAAWAGLALSLSFLVGAAVAPVLGALWLLYLSYVHVGQIFYGYGWEILLLETTVLAAFLCPMWRPGLFERTSPPSEVVFWLLRWLAFRLMFGAGLIKLRGDSCWKDLTCLLYHYETQPIPNPLSYYFHFLPRWFHEGEVLFNHFVELVVPFLLFGPRPARHFAGVCLVGFQLILILSGNLSFLNWLTIAICVSAFDDSLLARVMPARLGRLAAELGPQEPSPARRRAGFLLAAVVAVLSVNPVANLLSPSQAMNAAFEPFELVNTYGAFGSVGRQRLEVVLEGTDDEPGPSARWLEYELPCKPGNVARRPCITSPYHRRLDWQLWFAAMSEADREPWFVNLVYKLLKGEGGVLGLFARVPFESHPPRFVRARLYQYAFAPAGEGAWWRRSLVSEYLAPLSSDDPRLLAYLESHGLLGR